MRRRASLMLATTSVAAVLLIACGAAGSTSPVGPVRVSGTVAKSCIGPIVVGQPRRCSDRAVFERRNKRVAVHGRFAVTLARGTYRVSVDTCKNQQTLKVTHPIKHLRLVPRCPVPL